ncbi:hypothetical protein Naga_100146g4 [Nannochloropsis gaditana]|uniref:Uncharacterized protein n=1 Tax=Nannochloropsis gaditana TaxID=72520 RepID=W7TXU8_9STRA|nr:hypothetical protein Naga_100146g4 [Nannochloropsis gaditana]
MNLCAYACDGMLGENGKIKERRIVNYSLADSTGKAPTSNARLPEIIAKIHNSFLKESSPGIPPLQNILNDWRRESHRDRDTKSPELDGCTYTLEETGEITTVNRCTNVHCIDLGSMECILE